jgi:hypothetical protein
MRYSNLLIILILQSMLTISFTRNILLLYFWSDHDRDTTKENPQAKGLGKDADLSVMRPGVSSFWMQLQV